MWNVLHKAMRKAVNKAGKTLFGAEFLKESQALTQKEMGKRFPHKKKVSVKKQGATKGKKRVSRTPSSPAAAHREGARWIKNLNKQTKADRLVAAHHGKK